MPPRLTQLDPPGRRAGAGGQELGDAQLLGGGERPLQAPRAAAPLPARLRRERRPGARRGGEYSHSSAVTVAPQHVSG
eukprot:1188586-Prorocentrum_minimum.AAC.1